MADHITLKWGMLKGWDLESEAAVAAADRYFEGGMPASAAMQERTETKIQALIDLIDAVDASGGEIWNDWDNRRMDRGQARDYVVNYGANR